MKKKKLFKPKDVAKRIGMPPARVSKLATDIESYRVHFFSHTPLGSFLFNENDIKILKEYKDILNLFKKPEHSMETLEQEIEHLLPYHHMPEWFEFLKNSK